MTFNAMEWTVPFIIYRVNNEGQLVEVFHAPDIKAAKYWLSYIAEPWDVLCRTPLHPKHSKHSNAPEYWSHKELSREACTEELVWRKFADKRNFTGRFPEEQSHVPTA